MIRIVSYNTQFCTGLDGRTDLDRIASEVASADVMALQEIDRFWQRTGHVDQAGGLADRFPGYYWAYGPGVDVDASYLEPGGRLVNRRRQFGNMVFARWPILMVRNHLLPKLQLDKPLSLQRSALETVVALPDGPCRVISVHLAHAAASERLLQIDRLLSILKAAPRDGGAWSGVEYDAGWGLDAPPPPQPTKSIVMGDFNFEPNSDEYALMFGGSDREFGTQTPGDGLADAWTASSGDRSEEGATYGFDDRPQRLDYILLTNDLVENLRSTWVDQNALGSDHKPVWAKIDIRTDRRSAGSGQKAGFAGPT